MKAHRILALAAALTLSFAVHAHDCSGGAGGGMDATGNQCGDEGTVAAMIAPGGAPAMLAPATTTTTSTHAAASAHRTTRHVASAKPANARRDVHAKKNRPVVS